MSDPSSVRVAYRHLMSNLPEGGVSDAEVLARLRRLSWDRSAGGGSFRDVEKNQGHEGWSGEPRYRERLDHYGNNGEGWDEEAWDNDYANPLRRAIEGALDKEFGRKVFTVDIGEKGRVLIYRVK